MRFALAPPFAYLPTLSVYTRSPFSQESTREEVGCGGNEDQILIDVCSQKSKLKWYGHVLKREEYACGQESDGNGSAWEKRLLERKTEAEVLMIRESVL